MLTPHDKLGLDCVIIDETGARESPTFAQRDTGSECGAGTDPGSCGSDSVTETNINGRALSGPRSIHFPGVCLLRAFTLLTQGFPSRPPSFKPHLGRKIPTAVWLLRSITPVHT